MEFEIDTINAKFTWHDLGNGIFGVSDSENYLYLYPHNGSYYYDHYKIINKKLEKQYLSQKFTEFDLCYHQAIDYACKKMEKKKYEERHLEYNASAKQLQYIQMLGYTGAMPTTLGHAQLLIDKLLMLKGLSKIKKGIDKNDIIKEKEKKILENKIKYYKGNFTVINNIYILDGGYQKIIINKLNSTWIVEQWNSDRAIWIDSVKTLEEAKYLAKKRAVQRSIYPKTVYNTDSAATEHQMKKIREEFPWDYRDNITKSEASTIISTNILEEFIAKNKIISQPNYPVPCVI
jgi:hypothetical protein